MKKNIIASFLLKVISVCTSFVLVPITLNFLDEERYGVWLTLSSIIGWFNLFDIGLGNGLRNKFAEARATDDHHLAKVYISTTFAILSIVIGLVFIAFIGAQPFLNWSHLLNTSPLFEPEISLLSVIVFAFFCLQFIFRITTTILLADQKTALSDLVLVGANVLTLIIIYGLLRTGSKSSLVVLGTIASGCPVIALIIAYVIMFSGKYRRYKPALSNVDFKYSKQLFGLGLQFFITQIASFVVFATSNIIITQLLGPSEVTTYNIAFKYFSIITILFQIILNPFWSAYTEAYVKNEFEWIKNSTNKLLLSWGICCVLTIFMLLTADFFYIKWVGGDIHIPFLLSTCLAVYVCIGNWNNIFVAFNCGASKVRMQVWLSLFAGLLNIPLSLFFIKVAGVAGVVMGMTLSIIPGSFFSPIQYWKIINKRASGIWNK